MIDQIKNQWFEENKWRKKSLMIAIETLTIKYGYVINVEGLEIPKDIFKEEYDTIRKALSSVYQQILKYNSEGENK